MNSYFNKTKKINTVKKLCALVLICVVVVIALQFNFLVVSGESMSPTFADGQLLLAKKMPSSINYNSIIAFNIDNHTYIKRVIALENDTVIVDEKNGIVYVNNKQKATYIGNPDGEVKSYNLSKNKFFVLGDNYDDSIDSRDSLIGLVSISDIIAVCI